MAEIIRACSVDGCDGIHKSKGFCNKHYQLFRKHGIPRGPRASRGESLSWLRGHIDCPSDECLIWPFCRNGEYGRVFFEGRDQNAHRVALILFTGIDPKDLEAAHGPCHNPQCVNPNHLSWKTSSENHMDKVRDGTHHRGERNPSNKITEEEILLIRKRCEAGEFQHTIAKDYGINSRHVSRIKLRRTWKWLN